MAKSSFHTERNTKLVDKPNEDCFICDDKNGIYIVLDGVSRDKENGFYPNPSPATEISKIVLEIVYEELVQQCNDNSINVYNAICKANTAAHHYNEKHRKNIGDFLSGTVGVVAVIRDGILSYGYIGDCIGAIIEKDKMKEFTKMQTKNIAEHKGEFSAYEIRNIICNNKNHMCGYGVINGQEGAKDFISTGEFSVNTETTIFLASDGCELIFENASLNELKTLSAEELISTYTNIYTADDRTLILIKT